jgi:hypothetical protein
MAWRQAGTRVGQLLEPATARHIHQFARRPDPARRNQLFSKLFHGNRVSPRDEKQK